ncbi:MAG: hypothetical protein A2V70_06695 [Planctomycetes bacterium RBG_13_63_9]|nr:MAG: hypothetical protein A2V70_06695 [Planctomycetes bacterium RBG_13_63_9]
MSFCRLLADLIVVVHFAWVAFVVLGMVLILVGLARRWRWVRDFWFRGAHFLMIAIVVAESLGGIVCPLTQWECNLRVKGGDAGRPGSFVGRWVHDLIYFESPQWLLTVVYCLFGAAVLLTWILAPPHWPRQKPAAEPR